MIDLGRKESTTLEVVKCKQEKTPRMYYPSFYVDNKDLNINSKLVGKEITAIVKLRLNNLTQRANKDGTKYDYNFDILGIDFNGKSDLTNKLKQAFSDKQK